jgi:hypothetical protein
MLARDVAPSRIERAKAELERLLHGGARRPRGRGALRGRHDGVPPHHRPRGRDALLPRRAPVGVSRAGHVHRPRHHGGARPAAARPARGAAVAGDSAHHRRRGPRRRPRGRRARGRGDGVQVYIDAIGSAAPEPIPAYSPDGRMVGLRARLSRRGEAHAVHPADGAAAPRVATAGQRAVLPPAQGEVGIDAVRRQLARLRRSEVSETQKHRLRRARAALPVAGVRCCWWWRRCSCPSGCAPAKEARDERHAAEEGHEEGHEVVAAVGRARCGGRGAGGVHRVGVAAPRRARAAGAQGNAAFAQRESIRRRWPTTRPRPETACATPGCT